MDDLLRSMEEYAALRTIPVIGRDGAALLAATVAEAGPRTILEIGTAIGYSTLLMAERAPNDAVITTIEVDAERAAAAAAFFRRSRHAGRIDLLVGDAAAILPVLGGTYDFLFIDAAKAHYLDYLAKAMDKLRPGAVVFADNVYFYGLVTAERPPRRMRTLVKRMRAYLDFVNSDARFATTVHPIGDGIAISRFQGDDTNAHS
ncbi:O-methyltransferase [Anaeroselena agilis]|uniref:O-methyltransferase n=1 Tax=Anaeroselena agilis TaxID=3063788 RepID=A0ABU3NW47_9FIRM|nr:O-methyltransferase [Selenomonadales bacterium 4137-cl]